MKKIIEKQDQKKKDTVNVKKKIKKSENNGRNELMEYVTNLNNQNYAIKQKALNNARTDYSASNPAVKTRLEDAKKMEMLRAIRAPLNPLNSANTIMSTEAAQPIQSGYIGAYGAARGGRITLKSGGRVRGVGIAKRGFSKSLRKNKVDNN